MLQVNTYSCLPRVGRIFIYCTYRHFKCSCFFFQVLYTLNNEFKNVSGILQEKSDAIGGAKDKAVDLQKRANELANSATNKMSSIIGKS